jgi:iron complex transport system substrate-binding protein
MLMKRPMKALSLVAASVLLVAGCTSQAAGEPGAAGSTTIQVEDNNGTQAVAVPPKSVVVTDNRTFQTLAEWDVKPSAAARALMPSTNKFKTDESIVDLGTHNEPKLEAVVAAEPDLIINGQRFTPFHDDFAKLAPEATVLALDPREGQPLDAELKRQVAVLGEVFGKQAEAAKLGADLDAGIARTEAAYDPAQKVMAVNVSGGNIGYIAPGKGRTLGPVFDLVGLTPALQVDGASDDHQGDDISVEAIAASNPDWILVMDRDAAVSTAAGAKPASEILESSEALAGVTAVREGNIVYLPADTYTNEGIQTYTTFFNSFADALEGKG